MAVHKRRVERETILKGVSGGKGCEMGSGCNGLDMEQIRRLLSSSLPYCPSVGICDKKVRNDQLAQDRDG